ncbi:hypothetical protein L3N51_01315 [Metallosphaera sp. J1]|nr:hypothetical protein [Metallosphaera javensis (ex Hofmann et al. 2022)]
MRYFGMKYIGLLKTAFAIKIRKQPIIYLNIHIKI